jgi:DNA invertase Pin-like site-specific DNA recombinase
MNDGRQAPKMTILYERLSKDDDREKESNSITNQRALLEEYAAKNGFVPYINISDDGYSGTNFRRPGWEKLIDEVEAGNVSTLIIKDLTRMGRNYLRTGMYREMFQEKGVRLIALNDGFDSINGEDDFTPFKEIIAEMYARDTSKKIKSVLHKKGRDGKPLGTVPLYGYRKDPEDKNRRIIDDEAAEVVRRIFRMTVEGIGPWRIAKILMDEKVERPSYYS